LDHALSLDYYRACKGSEFSVLPSPGARAMEDRATSRSGSVTRSSKKRSVIIALSLALIVAVSWVGSRVSALQHANSDRSSQALSPASEPGSVHALARIEPASGLIMVGARPGARIERITVNSADSVSSGQLLAILEGNDQARAQLASAEAQKARALHERAVQRQKLALEREQFDALQKARLAAATRVFSAQQRFAEITKLYKALQETLKGKDRYDLELSYFQAETENLRGEQEIKSYQVAQELLPRQRKLEDEELGDKGPDLDLLDRQLDLARAGVAQTAVRAPSNGRVLEIFAHPGEVSTGALLTVADLSAMVANAGVFQADVPKIRSGDSAVVAVLDRSVAGKVTAIGSIVGKNQLNNVDPRALQDRRVVKVTISLDDPAMAARFVNMEVEVSIQPGSGNSTSPAAPSTTR
jgi:ABC exporter DevB family membrane fusion protein